MNALSQYIDLFTSQRATIEANAPAALNQGRENALAILNELGRLPQCGDEGFEKISINDIYEPDYGLNISRLEFPADARQEFSCDVPAVGALSALIVNDAFMPTPGLEDRLPQGVTVMSLAEAARKFPERFAQDIAPATNPIVALNTLFVQDGAYIRIDDGITLDKPIQLLSIFNTSAPTMAARRIRIDLGQGAKATVLVCDHPRVDSVDYLSCRVIEANVGENASLDFYDLEESTAKTRRTSVFAANQARDSKLNVCSIFLNGGITRNEFYPQLKGDNCTTHIGGMVIGSGNQTIDNATFLTHDHSHCTSSQLFKYALFDSAQGAFEGMVTVAPNATFTDAKQSNRNLLASPDARMHAMPQLIINCDEVKASHGSATGQLDQNALFYMRSRGIPEAEARMMLVNAFMIDVLDAISLEPLRERLRHLVDRRLRGCESLCHGCEISQSHA